MEVEIQEMAIMEEVIPVMETAIPEVVIMGKTLLEGAMGMVIQKWKYRF